jgi:hypothetical protein
MSTITELVTAAAGVMGHKLGSIPRCDDLADGRHWWVCVVPECRRTVIISGCCIYGSAVDERCPGVNGDPHANCPDWAWRRVTCQRCRRHYVCTPGEDYYCAAEGDHCCESCLVAAVGLRPDQIEIWTDAEIAQGRRET